MLKKLSVRWRMTLLSALLLTVCCVGITLVLNFTAYKMADAIDASIATPAPSIAGGDENTDFVQDEPPVMSDEIYFLKRTFSIQSIVFMLFIILGGSTLTYYVSGKALEPLSELNNQVKNLTVQNLSQTLPMPQTKDEISELTESFNEMTAKLEESFPNTGTFLC